MIDIMKDDLDSYIEAARSKGIDDEKIKKTLEKQGWQEKEILLHLTPIPPSTIPSPPLPPVPHFSMWIAFEYILQFVALYLSAISFSTLVHFAVDDIFFPNDPLSFSSLFSYSSVSKTILRVTLATLLVAYPVFASLFLMVKKQEMKNPNIRNIASRKMLIYLTLIVTFLITIGNIISTVYHFLEGSMTLRSITHLITTLIITGGIFFYYLWEVKEDRKGHV